MITHTTSSIFIPVFHVVLTLFEYHYPYVVETSHSMSLIPVSYKDTRFLWCTKCIFESRYHVIL